MRRSNTVYPRSNCGFGHSDRAQPRPSYLPDRFSPAVALSAQAAYTARKNYPSHTSPAARFDRRVARLFRHPTLSGGRADSDNMPSTCFLICFSEICHRSRRGRARVDARWTLPATMPNYAKRRLATLIGSLPYEAACWIPPISRAGSSSAASASPS